MNLNHVYVCQRFVNTGLKVGHRTRKSSLCGKIAKDELGPEKLFVLMASNYIGTRRSRDFSWKNFKTLLSICGSCGYGTEIEEWKPWILGHSERKLYTHAQVVINLFWRKFRFDHEILDTTPWMKFIFPFYGLLLSVGKRSFLSWHISLVFHRNPRVFGWVQCIIVTTQQISTA